MSLTHRAAFTLVELLVVIAIVAILASLVVPAVTTLRESARSLTCASNQRQFSVAFQAYHADNNGYWPSGSWHKLLNPYINPDGEVGDNTHPTVAFKPARCPSAPLRNSGGSDLLVTYSYTGVYWQSWNVGPIYRDPTQFFFGWVDWVNSPYRINVQKMAHGGEKAVMSEMWNDGAGPLSLYWGNNQLNDQRTTRMHGMGANMVFGDGHAQIVKMPGVRMLKSIQWTYIPGTTFGEPLWRPYNTIATTRLQ